MTVETKPKVKLFSRFSRNAQWGVGFIFQKLGLKTVFDSKWFKILSLLLFILAVTLSFLKKEDEVRVYKSATALPENLPADKPLSFSSIGQILSDSIAFNRAKNSRQGRKLSRAEIMRSLGPQIVRPHDSLIIPPGTTVVALLVTGASNGLVKAKLSQSILVDGETLIDEGATLLGLGTSTDERLMVTFSKIILSDGTTIKVLGNAYESTDQIVGLKGSKVGAKTLQFVGGIGLGFLGGVSEGLESSQTVGGVEIKDNSLRNSMLNGAAHASIDESKELINDFRAKKMIIEVPAKTPFTVLFDELPRDREK